MDGEEERLQPLLKNLTNAYMGPDHTKPGGVHDRLTIADIDAVAKRSFPLCMKAMYARPYAISTCGRCSYSAARWRSASSHCTAACPKPCGWLLRAGHLFRSVT